VVKNIHIQKFFAFKEEGRPSPLLFPDGKTAVDPGSLRQVARQKTKDGEDVLETLDE
jgi:hypothetical protein